MASLARYPNNPAEALKTASEVVACEGSKRQIIFTIVLIPAGATRTIGRCKKPSRLRQDITEHLYLIEVQDRTTEQSDAKVPRDDFLFRSPYKRVTINTAVWSASLAAKHLKPGFTICRSLEAENAPTAQVRRRGDYRFERLECDKAPGDRPATTVVAQRQYETDSYQSYCR